MREDRATSLTAPARVKTRGKKLFAVKSSMFFRHFLWVTLQLRRSSDSESTDVLKAGRMCIYRLA